MNKINFIVENFRRHEAKEFELIKKVLDYKPSKINQNTLFLRKFTLAILKQYSKKNDEEKLFTPEISQQPIVSEKINLQAPLLLKLDFNLDAPRKFEI